MREFIGNDVVILRKYKIQDKMSRDDSELIIRDILRKINIKSIERIY